MRRILILALTLSLALAGCTFIGGDDDEMEEPTPTPTNGTDPTFPTPSTPTNATPTPPTANATLDSSTYALAVAGVPTQAKPGARIGFTLFVNGTTTAESDHIGAHFADNDTTNPPVTGRQDCEHTAGALPGTYGVNCTLANVGTWYVWGHARINNSGALLNWWTPQASIVKVRDYNLTVGGVPTNAQPSNGNFTILVNVTALGGSDNATSDHIGAHYWNASEANPTTDNAAGACIHVAGGVVGSHTITCAIPNDGLTPKDFFLRGHIRIAESGTTLSWWSAESKVSILGTLPGSPI
jgi:hypothetical protein